MLMIESQPYGYPRLSRGRIESIGLSTLGELLSNERTIMNRIADFWSMYKLYRQYHPRRYAAKIAWGIAVKRLPF